MTISRPLPIPLSKENEKIVAALHELRDRWPRTIRDLDFSGESALNVFPHLFIGAFRALTETKVRPLAVAGRLLADAIFTFDESLDGDAGRGYSLIQMQAIQAEAIRLMAGLFPAGSRFWDYFHRYFGEFLDAHQQEQEFINGNLPVNELTDSLAIELILGKHGMARLALAGLSELAGEFDQITQLEESVDRYSIARQMIDDLRDWRADFSSRTPSLVLARALRGMSESNVPLSHLQDADEVGRVIYYCGHAEYVLEIAKESIAHSAELTKHIPELFWNDLIHDLRLHIESLLVDFPQIENRNRARASS